MPDATDRRQHDHFTVDPMYSSVVVTPVASPVASPAPKRATKGSANAVANGGAGAAVANPDATGPVAPSEGHLYEVSLGGMRFELDEPVPAGALVRAEISLPGCGSPIQVDARIVRVYDEVDDPGPRRMVAEFETFATGARAILERYLAQKWLRRAPVQATAQGFASASADEAEPTCEVMIETNDASSKGSKRRRSASAA